MDTLRSCIIINYRKVDNSTTVVKRTLKELFFTMCRISWHEQCKFLWLIDQLGMHLFTFWPFTKRPDGCYGGILPYFLKLDDLTVPSGNNSWSSKKKVSSKYLTLAWKKIITNLFFLKYREFLYLSFKKTSRFGCFPCEPQSQTMSIEPIERRINWTEICRNIRLIRLHSTIERQILGNIRLIFDCVWH